MKKFFVVGDVHGEFSMLQELLTNWDEESEQLLFLGDLNDRGPKTKDCFLLAKQLVEEKNAIYLMGNHEVMFLDFVENPTEALALYQENGGKETLESFFFKGVLEEYSSTEIAMMLKSQYGALIEFLNARPLYAEWKQYIFVHAGVNLDLEDWHDSTANDFLWTRTKFHLGKNRTGKRIVFGHTPTVYLNGLTVDPAIWLKDGKVGMDGGAVFGYLLYGVVFTEEGISKIYFVEHENWKKRKLILKQQKKENEREDN